jgi:hypothetical protein
MASKRQQMMKWQNICFHNYVNSKKFTPKLQRGNVASSFICILSKTRKQKQNSNENSTKNTEYLVG